MNALDRRCKPPSLRQHSGFEHQGDWVSFVANGGKNPPAPLGRHPSPRDTWPAMSEENVDVVRMGYEAMNRGDLDAVVSRFDPDAEIVTALSAVQGGSYRGHRGLRSWWGEISRHFADVHFAARDLADLGDVVLATTTVSARGQGSAVDVEQEFTHVFRFRGARIVWFKSYMERAAAIEALGLRE
jgi:ketosteroid isomerase-like protein